MSEPARAGAGEVTWREVADAVYLASVIGSRTGRPGEVPEISRPVTPGPAPGDKKDMPSRDLTDPPPRRPRQRSRLSGPVVVSPGTGGNSAGSVHLVEGVQVPPLPGAAGIVRALRPLHRKVLSRRDDLVVLDEEATADRAVQDGLWMPMTTPATEPWLDLTLLVDAGPSMALWHPTIAAFETLLTQLGTFRTIQRRLLEPGRPGSSAPKLRGGTPKAPVRGPAQLVDPSGRRVVLILTDGVSENWVSESLSAMLATFASSMPIAIVHLLPQSLWRRNGLRLHRARLWPRGRLNPNRRWSTVLPDDWLEPDFTATSHHRGVPVPVLELKEQWLRRLTRLLIGDNDPVDVPVLLTHETTGREEQPDAEPLSPHEQVMRFLSVASPTAFRLATLLAAVPVTLQAARLIQDFDPGVRTEHIAEVLSSPLFEPQSHTHADSPWDTITFTVSPGVRKELLSNARRSETAQVVRLVSLAASETDGAGHVLAALDSPGTTPDPALPAVPMSDLIIERVVMEALSGPYLSVAGYLSHAEKGADPSESDDTAMHRIVSDDMTDTVDLPVRESSSWVPVPRQPGDGPPIWGNVPPRNFNFTGRADLLAELGERLVTGNSAVLPKALHGMGGVGKTQTVVEYIYQHLDDYDLVWWIEASRETQIRASLTELAQALGLPGGAEANTAVPAVREALRRGRPYRRWLLVFDAAEGPQMVRPFFPTNGSGDILITSRNPDWSSVAHPLEVATFDRVESVELLRLRGPDIGDEDADRLADTLGDLPLAIEQAAAWRAETGMPVEEYLRLFDEKVAEILDTSAPSGYELSVAAAWNVSFDELKERSPAAHQLLQICAFFSPEPISRHIFSGVRGISIAPDLDRALRDPMQLSRAIRDINRYGLAKIDHRNNTLQLHRLVQIVLRNRMAPGRQEEMQRGAQLLLANFDPKDPLLQANWQRYRDVLPHVYAAEMVSCDDEWGRELVVNLMNFLYRWGDHDEAVSLARQTLEKWRADPGEQDPQTLKVASRLAFFYWVMGDFEPAAELNLHTLEIRRRIDGENCEDTLALELSVARDLRAQGDFAGAARISGDVYEKARALFPEDDPTTLEFARNHAICLRVAGRYREAARLDDETHRRLVEVLGNDHPETLSALSGLIMDRREAGEYLWARNEQEKLAIRAREMHGENSADTLRRRAYLAVARRKAGDHEGALELSTEVLESFRVRYGQGNFNVLSCALGQSIDLRHAGDLRAAKQAGEQVLNLYRDKMGDHHPFTKCAEVDLAVTLRLSGDPAAARTLDNRALEQLRTGLGPDYPHAIMCSINLASDLAALGDANASMVMNTEALERAERVLGADHPTTLAASLNLVLDLRSAGRQPDAEGRYADVISRYRKVLGQEHRATLDACMSARADCDIDPLPL